MSQLDLAIPPRGEELRAFFDRLDECRDKTSLTHGLHPYPAKFIPHIPRALLNAYAPDGATVWDPMCGSGTTLVEASLGDWASTGTDLNPVAVLASTAKTTCLTPGDLVALRAVARELQGRAPSGEVKLPVFHNRDHWFSRQVASELADAKLLFGQELADHALVVALCAFSAIIVQVSHQESETRWCAKPAEMEAGEVYRRLASRIEDAIKRLGDYAALHPASVSVSQADARASGLADGSVDVIVTSPPYANAHDYYLYNKLRMFWLGFDVRPVQEFEIGSRHRHSDLKQDIGVYLGEMEQVYREMTRVLVPGGFACVVVADAVVRGELFDMGSLLSARAVSAGLELADRFDFNHRQFNAAFQRGFGTAKEKRTHVLVHRKPLGSVDK